MSAGDVKLSVVEILKQLLEERGDVKSALMAQLKAIGRSDFNQLLAGFTYSHPEYKWTGMGYIVEVLEYLVEIGNHSVPAAMGSMLYFSRVFPECQFECLRMCKKIKVLPYSTIVVVADMAVNPAPGPQPEMQIEALGALKECLPRLSKDERASLKIVLDLPLQAVAATSTRSESGKLARRVLQLLGK